MRPQCSWLLLIKEMQIFFVFSLLHKLVWGILWVEGYILQWYIWGLDRGKKERKKKKTKKNTTTKKQADLNFWFYLLKNRFLSTYKFKKKKRRKKEKTKQDPPPPFLPLNPHCSPTKWWIRFLQWQEVTVSNLAVEWSTQSQIEQTPTAVQWSIEMAKFNRHLQQYCEAYNITKSNCTDTYWHVYSEAYNYKIEQTPVHSSAVMHTILNITVKLHRHLQICIQWSIQLQNWTDTCAQQCSDAYNIEYHKLHRHLQTCIQWSIQLQNWTETCSSAMMHTILNITESNCTDTYRHVYSEAYNMNISQSQTTQTLTDMHTVKHTITKLNRHLCTAVQWRIQYWISQSQTAQTLTDMYTVKHTITNLNRHLCTAVQWRIQYWISQSNCTDTYRHVYSEAYNYKLEQRPVHSSAVTHTILNITKSNCTDTYTSYRHVYREAYNYKIEQRPAAVQWSIQYEYITKSNYTDTYRHVYSEAYKILQNWTETCAQQCSEAYNITKSNYTDTYRHVCSEAYNYKIEQRPAAVQWSIQYEYITKSNYTDTYRHVCSEAYNYKIEQRPVHSSAVTHTILNITVKLHRHLQTCMHWSLQMQSGTAPVDTRLTFSDIPCVPPAWGRPSPPGWWPPAHSSPPALSPSGAHLRSRLSPSCTQVPSWVISVL